MEIITEFVQNQLLLVVPVGLAVLGCILLFTYSIRPTQQPKFNLSGLDDRKTSGKKKKLKEKKSPANGHVAISSTKIDKSPTKEQKKSPESAKKEKKVETVNKEIKRTDIKKSSEVHDLKKKTNKKSILEKPADYDEGDWETVPIKADKKKKVEPVPKKDKKNKTHVEQDIVLEESPKDEATSSLEELEVEPELKPEISVEEPPKIIEEPVPVVEEKKDKKKKKPQENKSEDIVETISKPVEPASQPPIEEVKSSETPTIVPSGAAFDELGDTWVEAKTVKKSKKKTRRD